MVPGEAGVPERLDCWWVLTEAASFLDWTGSPAGSTRHHSPAWRGESRRLCDGRLKSKTGQSSRFVFR